MANTHKRVSESRELPPVVPASTAEAEIIPWTELEKRAILNALRASKGHKLRAARQLGIGKTTLYRKLLQYGVK